MAEEERVDMSDDKIKNILKSKNNERIEELLLYLGRNPQRLTPELKENLVNSILTVDVSILPSLVTVLKTDCNEEIEKKINIALLERINDEKLLPQDVFDVIALIQSEEAPDVVGSQFYRISDSLINRLKKTSSSARMDFYESPDFLLYGMLIFTDKRFLETCFDSNNEKEIETVLLFIKKNKLSSAFPPELVPKLIELTESSGESVANTADSLLKEITLESGVQKNAWREWYVKNKEFLNDDSKGWRILTDKNLPYQLRESALRNLITRLYFKGRQIKENYLSPKEKLYQVLKNIAKDNSENMEMRKKSVEMIFSHIYIKKDKIKDFPEIKEDCIDLIRKIIPDKNELSDYIAMITPSYLLENLDVVNTLIKHAENNDTKFPVKIAVIRNLSISILKKTASSSSKRKEVAKCALNLLHALQQENEDTKRQLAPGIAVCLSYITGKKEAFNKETGTFIEILDFWRKVVSSMPDDPPEEGGN